jgi:hypothetical protein
MRTANGYGLTVSAAIAFAIAVAFVIGPGAAQASLDSGGGARLHAPANAPAKRELAAAKKKKKKKKGGAKKRAPQKPGAAGAAPPAADDDDDGDESGGDDASDSAAGSGAGDEDVKKAARILPKPRAGSDAGSDEATPVRARRSAGGSDETVVARAPARESGPSGPLPRALDASGGARIFFRSLKYNQLARGDVKEYDPRLLAGAGVSLTWYPAAHFTDSFAANVGLDVNVEQAFGITSRTSDGSTFPTSVHDYNGALRLRVPLGAVEGGVFVGYGQHAFTLTGGPGVDRSTLTLPDIVYSYVRAGLALRMALSAHLSLMLTGAYRHVLSAGEIKDKYFPNLSVIGIDASAVIGYPITSAIEARVGFDVRRYFYSMHSVGTDANVAGGAVDQYLTGTISIAVLLGGSEGGGSGSSGGGAGSAGSTSDETDEDSAGHDKDADVKVAPISPSRRKKKGRRAEPTEE